MAPPDSTGAIGPNNYVEMVNQQIGVYDRSLNLLASSDNGAFMGAGSLSVTDPQIQWDPQGGHWLYAALGRGHRQPTCSSSAGPRRRTRRD